MTHSSVRCLIAEDSAPVGRRGVEAGGFLVVVVVVVFVKDLDAQEICASLTDMTYKAHSTNCSQGTS